MTYCSISMYFTIIIGSYWLLDGEILNIELDDGKIYRKTLYLMVKTMVSCRFSLKSIQWTKHMTKPLGCSVAPWLVTICRPACCGADAAAPLFRGGGPGVHPRHATGGVVELGPVRHGMKLTENHAKPCRELMIFLVLDVFSRSKTSSFFDLGFRCFQCSLCCVLCRIPPPSPFRQEVRVEHSRFASAAEPESFVTEETSGPLVGEAAQGPLGTCCWGFGGILVRFLLVALISWDVATDSFVAFFLRRPCVASQRKMRWWLSWSLVNESWEDCERWGDQQERQYLLQCWPDADPACQGIQIRSCPTPQVKGIGGVIEMLRAVLGDAP